MEPRRAETETMADDATARWTAEGLLALGTVDAGRLFAGDAGTMKRTLRRLWRRWHSDRSDHPRADEVMAHVGQLYAHALRRTAETRRSAPLERRVRLDDGREWRIRYVREHAVAGGRAYTGRTHVTYVLDRGYEDLGRAAGARIGRIRLDSAALRRTVGPMLPRIARAAGTGAGWVMVVEKDARWVPLEDVAALAGGGLEARHVAWMVTRLASLACWLEHVGWVHAGIMPGHLLVEPEGHGVRLAGGWWLSGDAGAPMRAVSETTRAMTGWSGGAGAYAPRIDRLCIRETARALLGTHWEAAPAPIRTWIDVPGRGDAIEDYARWERALERGFGRRRFTRLGIEAADVWAMDRAA